MLAEINPTISQIFFAAKTLLFLIGAARYCGVSATKVSHVRQWTAANLVAATESRQVVYRFDDFIDAASSMSGDGEFVVRCGAITGAFATLEHHISRSSETRRAPKKYQPYAR